MKEEDKDLKEKIRNIGLRPYGMDFYFPRTPEVIDAVHDFVLTDRKEQKEKLLKKLPCETSTNPFTSDDNDFWRNTGYNKAVKDIKSIIKEQL